MAEGAGAPERALDTLFAAPLAEFIETRKRLAGELRKAGDRAGATALAAVGKPTASAWAVNQAVRSDPKALQALLATSDALAEAQLSAGGGPSQRERYQEAVARHREALERLVDTALGVLADGDHAPNPTLRERILSDLRWAPLNDEHRQALVAGRLIKDVGPQDFSALMRAAGGDEGGDALVTLTSAPSPAPRGPRPTPGRPGSSRPAASAPPAPSGARGSSDTGAGTARAEGRARAAPPGLSEKERAAQEKALREAWQKARDRVNHGRKDLLRTSRTTAQRQQRVDELEAELADARAGLARAREEEAAVVEELRLAEEALNAAAEARDDFLAAGVGASDAGEA